MSTVCVCVGEGGGEFTTVMRYHPGGYHVACGGYHD